MTSPIKTDHRSKFAAVRRDRMRKRLVESAMIVFAQKGLSSSVIQDVVAMAEVSQGSFYNYFRTNDDLLHAVAEELSNENVEMIEFVLKDIEEPGVRVAIGIRLYLHLIRSHSLAAQFVSSAGLRLTGKGNTLYEYLPRDLKAGQQRGDFNIENASVALDMIGGTGLLAVQRMANSRTPKDYPEQVAKILLKALGMRSNLIDNALAIPLPKLALPPDSLLARSQARFLSVTNGVKK